LIIERVASASLRHVARAKWRRGPALALVSYRLSGSNRIEAFFQSAPIRTLRRRSVFFRQWLPHPIREGTVALGLGIDPSLASGG
jgi:hypothetical protein